MWPARFEDDLFMIRFVSKPKKTTIVFRMPFLIFQYQKDKRAPPSLPLCFNTIRNLNRSLNTRQTDVPWIKLVNERQGNEQANEWEANERSNTTQPNTANKQMVQSENRSSPPEQRKAHAVGIGHWLCTHAYTANVIVAVVACFLNSQKPNEQQKNEQPNEPKAK